MVTRLSCIACKQRKTRCDKIHPTCSTCARRGVPCKYPSTFRNVPIRTPGLANSVSTNSLSERYYGITSANRVVEVAGSQLPSREQPMKEEYLDFPLLFDDKTKTQHFITQGLRLYAETAEFCSHEQFLDIYELTHNVDLFLETLSFPCRTLCQLLGVLLVGARYNPHCTPETYGVLHREFSRVGLFTEDCMELIQARLLLLEHYVYSLKMESTWSLLFSIVCAAYALGYHVRETGNHADERKFVLWRTIVFYDCLIGSTNGRPNATSCLLDPASSMLCDLIHLYRDTNRAFQAYGKDPALYEAQILPLDSRMSAVLDRKTDTDPLLLRSYRLLILTNQIKLHYPFLRKHRYSQYQLNGLLCAFSYEFVDFVRFATENAPVSYVKLRESFPFVSCHTYQTLAIVIACIKKDLHVLEPRLFQSFLLMSERLHAFADFLDTDEPLKQILGTLHELAGPQSQHSVAPLPIENHSSFVHDDPFFFQMFYAKEG